MTSALGLLIALLHNSDTLCCAQAAMAIANCALEPANADVIISQQVDFTMRVCVYIYTLRVFDPLILNDRMPYLVWCLHLALPMLRSMLLVPWRISAITACTTKSSSAKSLASCIVSRSCSRTGTSAPSTTVSWPWPISVVLQLIKKKWQQLLVLWRRQV
jgi:hypothetical protein